MLKVPITLESVLMLNCTSPVLRVVTSTQHAAKLLDTLPLEGGETAHIQSILILRCLEIEIYPNNDLRATELLTHLSHSHDKGELVYLPSLDGLST